MWVRRDDKNVVLPSSSDLKNLVSDLDNLNQRIASALLHLESLDQGRARDENLSQSHDVESLASLELKAVQTTRCNLQKLDSRLQVFQEKAKQLAILKGRQLQAQGNSAELKAGIASAVDVRSHNFHEGNPNSQPPWPWPLEKEAYQRYGRQLIMPEIGLQGQLRLKQSSVLIVGVGGLGCPAATYLAGAGIGTLGLMDGDNVELSNLHRQISHSTEKLGWLKVESTIHSLKAINPLVRYTAHNTHLTPQNALAVFAQYNLILDCTDHPTSRYLISDAAVLLNKPLVSASALRVDGQLTVLNNPPKPPGDVTGGPCYRCIFPKPPPAETVVSCSEGGILGPVVGVMGVLQALEAIKVIIAEPRSQHDPTASPSPTASLLVFSAFSPQPFRSVRLRRRKADCAACSAEATITEESLASGSMDYIQFCGVTHPVSVLTPDERITAAAYASERKESDAKNPKHPDLLVDVRDKTQFELCSLPGSVNVPYSEIERWKSGEDGNILREKVQGKQRIRVICRFGNDSQLAVRKIKELGIWNGQSDQVQSLADIEGGLKTWKRDVDQIWPDY